MANHANSNEARVPGWIWLLTGVALGALIMLLMRLSEMQPIPEERQKANSPARAEPQSKVTLDFYKVLKDSEILVEQRQAPSRPAEEDNTELLLQVASFRSLADAEQARAELILLNLAARIEKADVGKGETWHRVIVGPFTSRSQLAKARDTLFSNRFEALVIKRKKSS